MKLRTLFDNDVMMMSAAADTEISGLATDSRAVRPGDLFFALSGTKTDGSRYITQAMENGAAAVAGETPVENITLPFVVLNNARRALARAAIAILLAAAGHRCGGDRDPAARPRSRLSRGRSGRSSAIPPRASAPLVW